MKWSNITEKDVTKVVKKLSLEKSDGRRRADHPIYTYLIDGEVGLKLKFPNLHGGSGALGKSVIKNISMKFKLKMKDFVRLVECPMKADEYERVIRKELGLPPKKTE